MLLFLIGGGRGVKALLMRNFEGFASNSIVIAASETTKPYKGFKEGRTWNLQYKDIERLQVLVPELEVVTPELPKWGLIATRDDHTVSCHAKGVRADYVKVETPSMKFGRYLNEVDVQQKRKVCVIGERIWQSLFPDGDNPCGQYIRVGSVFYQVIGVDVSTSNINIGGSSAESVTLPITVMRDLMNSGEAVGMICAIGREGVNMGDLEGKIRQVIAGQHYIDPTDEEAMMVLNMEVMFSIMDNLFRGINFLIWMVGIGTLLAGAIGVSNIMLVVVRADGGNRHPPGHRCHPERHPLADCYGRHRLDGSGRPLGHRLLRTAFAATGNHCPPRGLPNPVQHRHLRPAATDDPRPPRRHRPRLPCDAHQTGRCDEGRVSDEKR